MRSMAKQTPMRRNGRGKRSPRRCFLRTAPRFITGPILCVDGGWGFDRFGEQRIVDNGLVNNGRGEQEKRPSPLQRVRTRVFAKGIYEGAYVLQWHSQWLAPSRHRDHP